MRSRFWLIFVASRRYRLAEALEAKKVDVALDFVAAAGHSDTEPGLVDSMIKHSDAIRDLLQKKPNS